MKLAELFIEYRERGRKAFENGLRSLKRRLERVRDSMKNVASMARNMLLIGGAALVGFIKISSDAQETASKFEAVFKDQTVAAEDFVQTLSKAVGRSTLSLRGFMATLQDTFVPLGFARTVARGFSQDITKLGIDIASFNNIADSEAIDSLTSALVGNHEAVRKFGIIITAASLDLKLMEMGFNKISKGATNQQKVMARMAIIIDATSDAQGDAVRTADSFANRLKRLGAEATEAGTAIGNVFLPSMTKLVTVLTSLLQPIAEWATANRGIVTSLTAVTAGMAAMLFLLPKITVALTFFIAHPVVAAIAAIAILGVVLASLSTVTADFDRTLGENISTLDAVQSAHATMHTRLIELLATQHRTNEEQNEANNLAKKLSETYSNLGLKYDSFGNVVSASADSMDRLTASMQAQMELDLEIEIEKIGRAQQEVWDKQRQLQANIANVGPISGFITNMKLMMGQTSVEVENLDADAKGLHKTLTQLSNRLRDLRGGGDFTPGGADDGTAVEEASRASRKSVTIWEKAREKMWRSFVSKFEQRRLKANDEAAAMRKQARAAIDNAQELAQSLVNIGLWKSAQLASIDRDERDADEKKRERKEKDEQSLAETVAQLQDEIVESEQGSASARLRQLQRWAESMRAEFERDQSALDTLEKVVEIRRSKLTDTDKQTSPIFDTVEGLFKRIQTASIGGNDPAQIAAKQLVAQQRAADLLQKLVTIEGNKPSDGTEVIFTGA